MRQVEENRESQDLQYQLVQRARSLGWAEANIMVIDDDLGKSAITSAGREDFQSLVAAVGLGQVGLILVTDVSRLARNCTDWFRLLDLASLCGTLLSDAGGVYDPRLYDDRLLLGLKGTFAEAQWYSMRTQLGAAKFNKAKRGALHLRLPVGFVRVADDRVALHPDQQVQSIIQHIFAEFERLGSAHKVLRVLRDQALLMPRRSGSSWAAEVSWVRPAYSAVYAILKNPAYAGAYAYGKLHRTHIPGDAHKVVMHTLPQAEWPVLRLEDFPGYISWETYQGNQQRLAENAQGTHWKRGAPRSGQALLQGIAICGRCGRLLHVHYTHATAYVCDHLTRAYAGQRCQTFTAAYIDPLIEQLFLQAVQPAQLQTALAALDQLEAHRLSLLNQWHLRLERARYDAQLARRRYEHVDPGNRLVAASLEQEWEFSLRQLERIEKEAAQAQSCQLQPLCDADRQAILALASDLPVLWRTALPAERKRLLRCLIQDVTLDSFSLPGFSRILVRWRTGATSSLETPRPRHGPLPATAVADHLRLLARHLPDDQIAEQLNAEGFPTATGLPWTLDRVRAVRRKHKITTACPLGTAQTGPRGDGLYKSTEVAKLLGVHLSMISQWFRQGLITGRQRKPGGWLWVRLTAEDLRRLDGSSPWQPELILLSDAPQKLGVTTEQIRAMILAGQFTPFRIHFQDALRWFLLPTISNPIT
jgi:DNA invertase Pin-like site-specific DNA recombinase